MRLSERDRNLCGVLARARWLTQDQVGFGPDTWVTENSRYIGDRNADRGDEAAGSLVAIGRESGDEEPDVGDELLEPGDIASGSRVPGANDIRDGLLLRGDGASDSSVAERRENGDAVPGRGDLASGSSATDGRESGNGGPMRETLRIRNIGDTGAAVFADALANDVSHG